MRFVAGVGGLFACAVALLPASTLAAVQAAAPAASAGEASRKNARALAEVGAPREVLVSKNVEWGRRAILGLPKLNEDSRALEAEFPGIHAAMWNAVEATLRRQLETELPVLWARLEQLYLAEMTEREIAAMLAFYRTPTGQRLISAMFANSDPEPVIEAVIKSEDGKISAESMQQVQDAAARKAVASSDLEMSDMIPLIKVMRLERMREVGQKVQEITQTWVNEETEGHAEIERLMATAVDRFIAQHESRSR